MPKRISTPPPGDDEPKYLSVVHPYARDGYCNMEFQKDRQDFARWVACCIDKDAFFAMFHKPSARDTVIVEVNRDYPSFDRILGEHRWAEFLQKPSAEEKDRVTQVFYCAYNTGRMVQKYGWKRIYVDEAWFKGWSPNNSLVVHPYPATHFCDVPIEDATNYPLCRPLPGTAPPPPVVIPAPTPVVGSPAWINSKESSATSRAKGSSAKAATRQQGGPGNTLPVINAAKNTTSSTSSLPRTAPAVGGGSFALRASNVWCTTSAATLPSTAINWERSSSSVSGGTTPAARTDSPITNSTASLEQISAAPPGLPARNNARNDRTLSVPDRETNSSAGGWWSVDTSASTSSPDTEPGFDDVDSNTGMVRVEIPFDFENEFHGLNIKETGVDGDHYDNFGDLDAIAPGWDETGWQMWPTPTAGGDWGDAGQHAETTWTEIRTEEPEKPLCSVHGVVCKKGICQEYAQQARAARRAQEQEASKAGRGKKRNNRGRGSAPDGGGRGRNGEADAQANKFRGAGAPVKTNWRGVPRQIVSADAIEQEEAAALPAEPSTNGWGDDDDDDESVQHEKSAAETASNDGWSVSETSFDPWAVPETVGKQDKGKNTSARPQKNFRWTK